MGMPPRMRLYPQHPRLRLAHVGADVGFLAWVLLWVLAARAVHGAVLVLAGPGRAVEDLGTAVADNMNSAAQAAQDVPLVGDELSSPFDALGHAGSSLGGAGQTAQDAVGTLAFWLALVVVAVPVGWLLLRWLPWRLRYAQEAGAAAGLIASGDLDLLAVRAMATAALPRLAALPPGTAAAWRDGDPAAARALARLELARLGLRLPATGVISSGPPGSPAGATPR
jgi:hypothetical protein